MTGLSLALLGGATVLYGAYAGSCCLRLLRRDGPSQRLRGVLFAALALHTAFVVLRLVSAGGLLIASRFDSVALFLWLTAVVFVAAARPYRIGGAAVVFWPLFAAGLVAMWTLTGHHTGERTSFDRLWLVLHLVPVYVGYAGFAVAAGAGLTYLLQERLLRRKGPSALWRRLPSLATLERVDRMALSLGFPALTVGLVAGIFWAERSSARLGVVWYADPKVLGGLVVWLFYAVVLHVCLVVRLRGRRAAWLTVAGFLLTLLSFVTVHTYAGSGQRDEGERAEETSSRVEPCESTSLG
jgi:ABC-type transport system involved in cytochrome c biogenesis permease subunit